MTVTNRLLAAIAAAGLLAAASNEIERPKAAPPLLGVKTPGVRIPFANLKPEAVLKLESAPAGMLFAPAFAVADSAGIHWFDAKTNAPAEKPGAAIQAEKPCGGMLNAFGSVWAASCAAGTLIGSGAKPAVIETGGTPVAHAALAASSDSVWMLADGKTTLLRADAAGHAITAEIRLPPGCQSILSAEASLWIACPGERLIRADPRTHQIRYIEAAAEPVSLASGAGSIWMLGRKEGKISRIDPKTGKVTATIDLETPGAGMLTFGGGFLWASVPGFPLARIDPATDKVAQQFHGEGGGLLWFGLGSLWIGASDSKSIARVDPRRVLATLAD